MKLRTILSALVLTGSLFSAQASFAWAAYYLGNQLWAIRCANGQMFSYSGSSAGLDVVGPALCPGGLAGPGGNNPVIVKNPPASVKRVVEGGCTPVFPPPRGVSNVKKCGGGIQSGMGRGMSHGSNRLIIEREGANVKKEKGVEDVD